MTVLTWTEGPWRTDPEFLHETVSTDRRMVADCNIVGRGISVPENRANATLIAAAPDLYDALHSLMEMINGWESTDLWCSDARAALARARGERQ